MTEDVAPQYVAARTVLLNALDALSAHRDAIVVVGAQAVYLRTGSAGLTVAPFTTDGDLALNPSLLSDDPRLGQAMLEGHFALRTDPTGHQDPGTWVMTVTVQGAELAVPVDLIVPAGALAGGKTRGARLPVHGRTAAKRAYGLEAALVDRSVLTVTGLAAGDTRATPVAVAGPAALLVAKVIKLGERVADAKHPDRQKDKDAMDVLRLIRAIPAAEMAARMHELRDDPLAGEVTRHALEQFPTLSRRNPFTRCRHGHPRCCHRHSRCASQSPAHRLRPRLAGSSGLTQTQPPGAAHRG